MRAPIKTLVDYNSEAAVVVAWYKSVGDSVKKGDLLLSVETMKVEENIESSADGVLVEVCVQEGGEIPRKEGSMGSWHATFGYIETEGVAAIEQPPKQLMSTPEEKTTANFCKASPNVRKVARERGIDLATINGSGPGGTIMLSDFGRTSSAAERDKDFSIESLSPIRKEIARNMKLSWCCIPHAGSEIIVSFRRFLCARQHIKEKYSAHWDVHAKYLRLELPVITAMVDFLKTKSGRLFNACYGCEHTDFEGSVKVYSGINIGVAYNHENGLMVPTLLNVGNDGYEEVARRLAALYESMKTAKISAALFKKTTITFNNVGAIGSERGQSIIPHGQSAIINLHAVEMREQHPLYGMANVSIRFDHRLHDGAGTMKFLSSIKRDVEETDWQYLEERIPGITKDKTPQS